MLPRPQLHQHEEEWDVADGLASDEALSMFRHCLEPNPPLPGPAELRIIPPTGPKCELWLLSSPYCSPGLSSVVVCVLLLPPQCISCFPPTTTSTLPWKNQQTFPPISSC